MHYIVVQIAMRVNRNYVFEVELFATHESGAQADKVA